MRPWQTIHFFTKKPHAFWNASVNRGGAAGSMAWVDGRAFVTLWSPLRENNATKEGSIFKAGRCILDDVDPWLIKPPPLNRDYNRDPNISALKEGGY